MKKETGESENDECVELYNFDVRSIRPCSQKFIMTRRRRIENGDSKQKCRTTHVTFTPIQIGSVKWYFVC